MFPELLCYAINVRERDDLGTVHNFTTVHHAVSDIFLFY